MVVVPRTVALFHQRLCHLAGTGVERAAAAQRMKASLLACDVSAGIGYIIHSHKDISCVLTLDGSDRREDYDGSITKFGLDVGITGPGRIGLGSIYRHGRWSRLPGRGLCRRECGSFACDHFRVVACALISVFHPRKLQAETFDRFRG